MTFLGCLSKRLYLCLQAWFINRSGSLFQKILINHQRTQVWIADCFWFYLKTYPRFHWFHSTKHKLYHESDISWHWHLAGKWVLKTQQHCLHRVRSRWSNDLVWASSLSKVRRRVFSYHWMIQSSHSKWIYSFSWNWNELIILPLFYRRCNCLDWLGSNKWS